MTRETVKFKLGDIVYRKVDPEDKGMITGIIFRPTGVLYGVSWKDGEETTCYDIELTTHPEFAT